MKNNFQYMKQHVNNYYFFSFHFYFLLSSLTLFYSLSCLILFFLSFLSLRSFPLACFLLPLFHLFGIFFYAKFNYFFLTNLAIFIPSLFQSSKLTILYVLSHAKLIISFIVFFFLFFYLFFYSLLSSSSSDSLILS